MHSKTEKKTQRDNPMEFCIVVFHLNERYIEFGKWTVEKGKV